MHLKEHENRYTWFRKSSTTVSNNEIENNSLDAVFVDADHSYEAVSKDLPFWYNKLRMNVDSIAKSISYHEDFHLKPVIDKDLSVLPEVEEFIETLAHKLVEINYRGYCWFEDQQVNVLDMIEYLKSKTWCMPAGDTRDSLFESYPVVMNMCRDKGYKFTGRAHIMAFNDMREV